MVLFKGKGQMGQCVSNKPKIGVTKFFAFAGSDKMMHDFLPYTGKIELVLVPYPDQKASSIIVLHSAQVISSHQNHILFLITGLPHYLSLTI